MDAVTRVRFQEIQTMYDALLPDWMADFERTGNMHHQPYVRNWLPEFSPIEREVWGEIREYGLPFYPQIPVAGFFLDFACPMLKIAIECDGAEFHDFQRDWNRDEILAGLGWNVFRLAGHECKRTYDPPWLDPDGHDHEFHKLKWFESTSAGFLYSLKQKYFVKDQDRFAQEHYYLVDYALNNHRTTPRRNMPDSSA